MLAGVSADYYTRLERGSLVGASDSVLDALARALQLDDAERDHLFDLARIDNAAKAATRAPASRRRLKPVIHQVLDAITEAAADIRNERGDIVAANKLGRALYSEIHAEPFSHPTLRGTRSSTRAPATSSSTGTAPPPMSSPCSAPPSDATPTTSPCQTLSANYPRAVTNSACAGPLTTSADTPPAPNACGITSSAKSNSTTKASRSPVNPDSDSVSSPPNPTRPIKRPYASSPVGQTPLYLRRLKLLKPRKTTHGRSTFTTLGARSSRPAMPLRCRSTHAPGGAIARRARHRFPARLRIPPATSI